MRREDVFNRLLLLEHKNNDFRNRNIVVYPYGTIGKQVDDILRSEFKCENIIRVDNFVKDDAVICYRDYVVENHGDVIWILATDRQDILKDILIQLLCDNVNSKYIFMINKTVLHSYKALEMVISNSAWNTVLDVGCGEGIHGRIMEDYGKRVLGINMSEDNYYQCKCMNDVVYGDFITYQFEEKFDVVWASHIMEHISEEEKFVEKLKGCVKKGGCIAITVPARESNIFLSHVHSYNAGRVLRFLLGAGIDCRNATIIEYGYNLSVIIPQVYDIPNDVDIKKIESRDVFDSEELFNYLPPEIKVKKMVKGNAEFDGDIRELNWELLSYDRCL